MCECVKILSSEYDVHYNGKSGKMTINKGLNCSQMAKQRRNPLRVTKVSYIFRQTQYIHILHNKRIVSSTRDFSGGKAI